MMFYLCCFGSHADGGNEEPPDRRQASVDSRQSRAGQGTSTENDCAFEPDYAIPPLPVTEGMQHIRIMEGMSRSLPSSPLLTHQSISVRLQPVKKLTGKDLNKVHWGFKGPLVQKSVRKKA
ncbi:hypothetical protein Nmel_018455 [Mimus melanotis]